MVFRIIKSRLAVILGTGLILCLQSPVLLSDIESIQKLTAEGKLDEALDQLNREVEERGNSITYRFMKGLILTRMEKLEEASIVFLEITESNPELPEPYNNLAVIYASLGDYDKARDLLERAINTHPAYATAHENIGDIYAKLASQAYNQALELDRENNSARAKLSLVNDLFSLPDTAAQIVVATNNQPVNEPEPEPEPVEVVEPEPEIQQPVAVVSESPSPMVDTDEIREREQELIRQNRALEQQLAVSLVKQTVLDWAAAWTRQNVDTYLSFYASDFTPDAGMTLTQWRGVIWWHTIS